MLAPKREGDAVPRRRSPALTSALSTPLPLLTWPYLSLLEQATRFTLLPAKGMFINTELS